MRLNKNVNYFFPDPLRRSPFMFIASHRRFSPRRVMARGSLFMTVVFALLILLPFHLCLIVRDKSFTYQLRWLYSLWFWRLNNRIASEAVSAITSKAIKSHLKRWFSGTNFPFNIFPGTRSVNRSFCFLIVEDFYEFSNDSFHIS